MLDKEKTKLDSLWVYLFLKAAKKDIEKGLLDDVEEDIDEDDVFDDE